MSSLVSQCELHSGNADHINDQDHTWSTRFMLAAQDGHVKCLEDLLGTGLVDITKEDKNGLTALKLAAKNGHVECVKFLLDTQLVDVTSEENHETSEALLLAVENGHVECLRVLLDSGKMDVINKESRNIIKAIILAAENGHFECIRILLTTEKIDDGVNKSDSLWESALTYAAKIGHGKCVELLLKLKVGTVDGINMVNNCGFTAFMEAAENGHIHCIQLLLDAGMINDINRTDGFEETALFNAAKNGHEKCVEFLLNTGMTDAINAGNYYGLTALMSAAENGHVECVELLFHTGMIDDINKEDNDGLTAFMLAAKRGHIDCVKFLLDTGMMNINKKTRRGLSAVRLTAENGHADCLKFLLDTGMVTGINDGDINSSTALMMAVENGHIECVKCLLGSGMNINVNKNELHSRTAFMLAASFGHVECLKCLLGTGKVRNLNKKNMFGCTAFALAASGGKSECLRCILDIAVAHEIPPAEAEQGINSTPLFTSNDSVMRATYAPGITWKPPYVHGRDQEGLSILKLTVGCGLARCLICLFLGGLDVPLTQNSACNHDRLEHSTLDVCTDRKKTTLMLAALSGNRKCTDYVLQYERIRFHTLVTLLRDGFTRTNQISLILYQKLCSLIWDSSQVNRFLSMMCDGSHPGECVDFLLSTFICQQNIVGESAFSEAHRYRLHDLKSFELLFQHIIISDSNPPPDSMRRIFANLPSLPFRPSKKDLTNINQHLSLFLRNGVFRWSWYALFPDTAVRYLTRALVIDGYSPGEFERNGKPSSPLHHAFMTGDGGLVRYLVANLYVTSRDTEHFQTDIDLQDHVLHNGSAPLQTLHHLVFCTPWKLRVLSLVKVSTLLTCKMRKEDMAPVDSLPIPQVFKKQLSFVDSVRMVDVRKWDDIDIESWLC